MSANRMHKKNAVHFVTNRCEHEMFLLLPSETITRIIQGWFARAVCKYGKGLEIYAFIFLSNHLHILAKDTMGCMAAFMWYFQSNVARAVNRELGRRGRFWAREYDDVIVEGNSDFWDRYGYITANAVKAGLVDNSADWPGWSSLEGALGDGQYSFELFNRTRYHNATRRGRKRTEEDFVETWRFMLATPPTLKGKSLEVRRLYIKEAVKNAEEKFRKDRGWKPALGIENIKKQHHFDRPQNPSFRPRTKFCCSDEKRKRELKEGYRIFVDGYRRVFHCYRIAAQKMKRPAVEWPDASFPPSCLYPVYLDEAA